MEIIIGLVILGGIAWFFFMRNDKKTEVAAPYKVESPAPVAEPVKAEAPKVEVEAETVEAPAQVVETPEVEVVAETVQAPKVKIVAEAVEAPKVTSHAVGTVSKARVARSEMVKTVSEPLD